MIRTAFANLRAHKLRLLLSSIAIMLGVGFVAGTMVLTDTMTRAYDDGFARGARNVDAAVIPSFGVVTDPEISRDEADELIPPSVLAAARALPQAAAVEGRTLGELPLIGANGKVVKKGERPGVGLGIAADPALRGFDMVSGTVPTAAGQAVVDKTTAQEQHWSVGTSITVLDTKDARHVLSLVGVIDFGVDQRYADQAVVGVLPTEVLALTGTKGYTEVDARAAPGVSQSALATAMSRLPGVPGGTAVTGSELTTKLADKASQFTKQFTIAIMVFAFVALFVAALVIANTFAILVAQRSRELALMRCVGATRRQVFSAVLAESTVVGFLASAAGVGVGVGLAVAIEALFRAAGAPIPSGSVTLSTNAVVDSVALGVIVTVLSAALPARAATKVAPVTALGSQVEARVTKRTGRVRIGIGAVLIAIGAGLVGVTLSGTKAGETELLRVAEGGGLVFLGVLVLGPVIVPPLAALLGWLPGRVFGPTAKLATANTRRNPRRVASTTAALTIGITLMSGFTVLASSIKVTAAQAIQDHFPFDYGVMAQGRTIRPVAPEILQALRNDPKLAGVATLSSHDAVVNGSSRGDRTIATSVSDPQQLFRISAKQGSMAAVAPGAAAVSEDELKSLGGAIGGTVEVKAAGGDARTLKIVATYGTDGPLGDVTLAPADFTAVFHPAGPDQVFVTAKAGVPVVDSRAAVEADTAGDPLIDVISQADFRNRLNHQVDQLLALFGALVGLAILIAFFGIANTLSLSVLERTRESALLRALGLTKSQLRRMLLGEAALMATVGIGIGVTVGAAFGWSIAHLFVHSAGEGSVSIPFGQIGLYVAAGALAGVVAAVLPSRRAARTSIVAAMADA